MWIKKTMYVCICKAVTDRQIRQAVELGACSLSDLKESLGVATGCGKCAPCAREILREELQSTRDAGFAFAPGT
ncbi:MAG TPA: bacterioferritin-associated ferredoxin [Burkholderiales bacterium]|nr:bacterioferritin-associated ferredoxin [Burkholderiales bacterium]